MRSALTIEAEPLADADECFETIGTGLQADLLVLQASGAVDAIFWIEAILKANGSTKRQLQYSIN